MIGGIVQHDSTTPVELLLLTPRRTKALLGLLVGSSTRNEAMLYFHLVGVVERNERGEYSLTEERGRPLAERIRACRPPLKGAGY